MASILHGQVTGGCPLSPATQPLCHSNWLVTERPGEKEDGGEREHERELIPGPGEGTPQRCDYQEAVITGDRVRHRLQEPRQALLPDVVSSPHAKEARTTREAKQGSEGCGDLPRSHGSRWVDPNSHTRLSPASCS